MKKPLSFYYSFILTAFSLAYVYADVPHLAGSGYAIGDVVASATDIVVGKFTKVKSDGAASMMGMSYHGQITISETLKGTDSGSLEVAFYLNSAISPTNESEPNLHDTYIMILTDHQAIRKLLPVTDDNMSKIKALIAAAPATQ